MKLPLFLFSIFICSFSFSQNLLVNGSFEDENICAEFHVNCSPEGWIDSYDVPFDDYIKDPSRCHSGNHCMALETGHTNSLYDRNFIRTQLLCKLRKGNSYKIELYLKSSYDVLDSIGIYFTSHDFLFQKQPAAFLVPSLYVSDAKDVVLKKDSSWQKITWTYIANGEEIFLTIGNFSKKPFAQKTIKSYKDHILFYVDDVSLAAMNPDEQICSDWQQVKDEIYEFNIRHQYLQKYIGSHPHDFPEPPQLSPTTHPVIDTFIIPDVLFETGKSSLTQKSFSILDSLCLRSTGKKIDSLVVEGHTDNKGSVELNQKLSVDRATAVANYMNQKLLLPKENMIIKGFGSHKPVADNTHAAGRQKNRRVEIFIYLRE